MHNHKRRRESKFSRRQGRETAGKPRKWKKKKKKFWEFDLSPKEDSGMEKQMWDHPLMNGF